MIKTNNIANKLNRKSIGNEKNVIVEVISNWQPNSTGLHLDPFDDVVDLFLVGDLEPLEDVGDLHLVHGRERAVVDVLFRDDLARKHAVLLRAPHEPRHVLNEGESQERAIKRGTK